MKLLTLNCQHAYQPGLEKFLHYELETQNYDILLLQEVSDAVAKFLEHPGYNIIRDFNEETGQNGQVCIVYKEPYQLSASGFKPFASMHNDPVHGFRHPAPALLWADITIGPKTFRFASIHLHSGLSRAARLRELRAAKSILLKSANHTPVILAGDFNTGFPRESTNIAQSLAPELVWMTKTLGPTLDSRYSENVAALSNRVAALLSIFNLAIRLRTDHIFIDQQLSDKFTVQCSILPERVSDHSPVESILNPGVVV